MMNELISELAEAQILAEKLADYANQLGEADDHRQAVDLHNAYLEERHHWEGERNRIVARSGIGVSVFRGPDAKFVNCTRTANLPIREDGTYCKSC
jgi:hypothetical protein